ncbi:flagellar filament capping protein FliD, partial [Microbacterium sp. NRRL B-14842]|uniref:flagellar filament capping protein FliD n=1 Tax=Microbacterium sp. NRRL B-14842 TaxID=3162881 RepID=UPI003D28FDC6
MTSSGNTFTDLFEGVDVTVSTVSTSPVTVTVAVDSEARAKASGEFIALLTDIFTRIDNGSKATVAAGQGEKTTLGVFTGDSTIRGLRTALADAIQHPVDGVSPSTVGISTDMYGKLTFDEEKFSEALAKDPAAVGALFSAVAGACGADGDVLLGQVRRAAHLADHGPGERGQEPRRTDGALGRAPRAAQGLAGAHLRPPR